MRWISEFVMGLSRYRNSPSCFWDREIRRRRDRDVLQRHKAGCADVIARPLLLRALNRQKSAAEAGTTAVSDCKEIGINTVVEFIDRRPIGLVRAENAALLVKVQRLKDKNKQLNQQLEERNSCFREYKRETSLKFLRLVKDRDTCNLQLADVQKSNAKMQAEMAVLRVQEANANIEAENRTLEVDLLKDQIRHITDQRNKIISVFGKYRMKICSKIRQFLQVNEMQNANVNVQPVITTLKLLEAEITMQQLLFRRRLAHDKAPKNSVQQILNRALEELEMESLRAVEEVNHLTDQLNNGNFNTHSWKQWH